MFLQIISVLIDECGSLVSAIRYSEFMSMPKMFA